MSFIKYAASAAAIVAVAMADDSSPCTFANPATITAAGDVSSLAACSTISGDVVFATGAAAPTLALPGVVEIDGDITYADDNTIVSFQAPMLKKISGTLKLNNLTHLSDVGLNSLQTSGDITITGCASLAQVVTGTQYSEAGTIELSNTYLSDLGGFGNLTKVEGLSISGNPLLADITMNIASVKAIDIGSNEEANNGLSVKFDNLTMAMDHIVVQNATNVSFASLKTVTNNLELIFNNFQTFAAPNLTHAGGLVLNSNPNLNNISLPVLLALNGTKGTFQIANNTQLQDISGFPQLTDLEHDVYFSGNFKEADISNFKKVAGAMYTISTQDISSTCDAQQKLKSAQVIYGKSQCTGKDPSASGTTTGTGSGGSTSSSAAAVPINIPALPALSAGLGAALLQFLLSF